MAEDEAGAKPTQRQDHYGNRANWFMDYSEEYLDGLVEQIQAIELMLKVEFGLQAFLTYGTLLGAVREGGFIGHDSDIDLGYVSRFESEAEIAAERAEIYAFFKDGGRVMGRPSYGRFQMRGIVGPRGHYEHGIELFTSFVRDGRFFHYTNIPGTLPVEAVLPYSQVALRGRVFVAPADTDAFLSKAVDPDWRVPKLPQDHVDPNGRYECFRFLYPRLSD